MEIRKILCFFGLHQWNYEDNGSDYKESFPRKRRCGTCYKLQESAYDMSYGEAYWVDIRG